MDAQQLEKYTSAITLSDMEIFVFPELIYSLVLADIMSPAIWEWRQADCFKKLDGKTSYKKLLRLKQFIMDEYEFNLDLNTWGLSSKASELKRFSKFISPEAIAQSNALFGYQGDKYYFNVDIRKHFGLDEYDGDIIPYWKTETVEAMNAFSHKPGYTTGAGECVSLSALYAAAVFIVCGIGLEDIYMILTPLHSQNFVDIQNGVLTNNRRIITKPMWFNGTAISNKAQRALRNEQVTVVAHSTGWVHCIYDQATIDKNCFRHFSSRLNQYLSTDLTPLIFANFLRAHHDYQKYFQFCRHWRGERKFIKAEILFHYEHGSNFRIEDATFDKLLAEVSSDDYSPAKLSKRICCEQMYNYMQSENINIREDSGKELLRKFLSQSMSNVNDFIQKLAEFLYTEPSLPDTDKKYIPAAPIKIENDWSREEVIDYLQSIRATNSTADLAFYAYRDMSTCDWLPFIKAAIERNPVSIQSGADTSIDQIYNQLIAIENNSIYDSTRLAQPDEVVNYQRGDGIEKAFVLANIIADRDPGQDMELIADKKAVILKAKCDYHFTSSKNFQKALHLGEMLNLNI